MKDFGINFGAFGFLLLICIICGLLYTLLNNWVGFLGSVFIVLTAGFFFFAGGNLVNQGFFLSPFWVVIFIVFLPIVLLLEYRYINPLEWYKGIPITAYFLIFTLGLIIRKLPFLKGMNKTLFNED